MTAQYNPATHEDDWSERPDPLARHRPGTVGELVALLGSLHPDTPLRFDYDPSFANRPSMADMYLRLVLKPTLDRPNVLFLLSERS